MERRSNTHVVVLFPGALGDLVLAMPAIAAVCARHADARVTLAVSGWLRGFAATSGVAHETVSLDDADATGLFGGTRLPSWFEDRPILYAWIGSRDAQVRARLESLAAHTDLFAVVRDDGPDHAAAVYAGQVGLGDATPIVRWSVPAATPRVESMLGRMGGPVLAVHAGAGSPAKRWAAEGFAEVARRWRRWGGDVVEVVGPAEHSLAPVPEARRIVDWPLEEVAAVLAGIDAYVGNDSGITHLAGAMGACGIAVFGPTDPARWAPRGGAVAALAADVFLPSGIPVGALPPDRVWSALADRGCLDKLPRRE